MAGSQGWAPLQRLLLPDSGAPGLFLKETAGDIVHFIEEPSNLQESAANDPRGPDPRPRGSPHPAVSMDSALQDVAEPGPGRGAGPVPSEASLLDQRYSMESAGAPDPSATGYS